ncbi:MAG: hypothetical protein HN936_05460 [Bacteroidetes bacterium]|jgi:uncharacterized protein (TIGR02145 family)|nr:hypothetical protein [Bacteroidota bacterium]MBT4412125.1 hypothetical protein [Bacteroidota bacterium]MBT5427478.1 hypothetical protein [Bacteroidota bacterium]MBT7092670.1 hypothetical protein [Bacteroidota bacterium]MBT7464166.1 hypothetical protein [Bacteroidota bacterium]
MSRRFYLYATIWLCVTALLGVSCKKEKIDAHNPVAGFSLYPLSGLTTDSFKFDASNSESGSAGINAYYRWDWNGDGIFDTEFDKSPEISYRYYAPGDHNMVLEVINSNGITDTTVGYVRVEQGFSPPHPNFDFAPASGNFMTDFILDASVSFDDEDSLNQLLFRWDWNGDEIWDDLFSSRTLVVHRFREAGTYSIGLQVQDPGKLSAKIYKTLEVHNRNLELIANFTWSPQNGTTADTFLLDASSSFYKDNPFATLFYSWRLPPEYTWTEWDTSRITTARFGRETDYQLEMKVRDTNYLIAQTEKEITIYHENLPPVPVLKVGNKRGNIRTQFYFDSWGTRDFESNPTSLEVRWDFNGDGNFDTSYSSERTIYHQYPEFGTYKVVLEVKDPEGLSDTTSQYVIVSPYTNETGLIFDHRDGRIYGSVKIGEQWWMSENLNFRPWDPNKDYVKERCYSRFCMDPINWCEVFGGLYNIYHATRNDFYNDVEGICPAGWHMPSRAEWENLIESIGGFEQADKLIVGGSSDFNVLYGGYGEGPPGASLCQMDYSGLGEITYLWSFKRLRGWPIAQSCWNVALLKGESRIYTGYSGNDSYFSVRCVKDDE